MSNNAQAVEPTQQPLRSPTVPTALKDPPGPPTKLVNVIRTFVFGSSDNWLSLYMGASQEYGDVVRMVGGPTKIYFVHHPDHVKHVLQDNNQNYVKKNVLNDLLKLFTGTGLLTSDCDVWRRRRKLAQPAFHREHIANFATLMSSAAESLLARWDTVEPDGRPLDMLAEMQTVASLIVGRALFSAELSPTYLKDMQRTGLAAMQYMDYRSRRPLAPPLWVPTRQNRRFQKAMRQSKDNVSQIIKERRQTGTDTGDLLGMLLAARDEDTGEGLTDQELRDEVLTFLGAGNETTAVTLTWAWYLLSTHPEAERKLHAELHDVLGGRLPTADDAPNLPYTRMIIDETLRLYPAAWAMSRGIVDDDDIGGYRIRKSAIMILSPYVTHRRPDLWESPEGFDPERFTPEKVAARPRYAYFPFGGGPRQCIGNTFALMEAQLVLATVAQHYRPCLVPGGTVLPDPIFTLRPDRPVMMTLQPRNGSA